jgi:GT2 family glycosyltransferase
MPARTVFRSIKNPELSVVIPSYDGDRGGNLSKLVDDLKAQTYKSLEIIVSAGEFPNGHARNVGVALASSSSKYYAFFDDDVRLGHEDVLKNFIVALSDPRIGLVGASQLPPIGSSWKQIWLGYDLAKAKFKIQKETVDTEMATHAGMACRRLVWEEMGGESDTLITGTDTDLRDRLRMSDYRVVVIHKTWVYHPLPNSFRKVLISAARNGKHQVAYRRKHGFQDGVLKPFKDIKSSSDFFLAVFREVMLFLPHIFISNSAPKIGFRPINALFRLVMVISYSHRLLKDKDI